MKKIMVILLLGLLLFSCTPRSKDIYGAGATFPLPLYNKMFTEYESSTGICVNYEGIGSGGGIYRLQERNIDFGATDRLIVDEMWKADVVHIPTCIGAVAIVYNLPANPQLQFSPQLLASIFLGEITHWNDAAIKQLNPEAILPNQRILVVNRSDESGTSMIFNDYLGKVSDKWQEREVNALKEFFALSVKNNKEMAVMISDTPGSIGFISLSYAIKNRMSYAAIQNSSGNFIKPAMHNLSLAANGDIPDHTRIYLTNTNAAKGYPISSFTWIILYRDLTYLGKDKAEKLVNLLNWMVLDGQAYAPPLNYAPLPAQVVEKAQKLIQTIKY